ncbi:MULTISPECIES: GDP-mannose pyrophosphatase NudK [Rahnella]|jgi:GDP-mannose pyrophosphatase NudK|uniref:GDP-mannose pyrophosphatase n=1 Tax=Rahnella victoriana TaxID=1510570 RepID=A0ABS0DLL6_9GAMM|nr:MULTISPECIES: GDP-mannose pyrophosphatase NudK [Rahnella]VTQ53945.1 Uridine diphosphate glucose pyrophosphatase [Campylobacter jejuni]MBF7954787.1 GDP-mannose pyrophosphatase NudK [Rahnella victoriana]PBI82239.1 GDP-mannose pyrophosphatase NudK [Rahnella victoriana]TBX37480.1 GDP-mannose pyrophosphatase NudK [Rahnella victoriana]TDS96932.1 GDP-mannose pyrophosphatase NudK [Rahnella sp. BIGb0236]
MSSDGKSSRIENVQNQLLSDNWYVLRKYTYDLIKRNGERQPQSREVYDRGNGATILLYNRPKKTVLLIKQFRMPTYVNGNPTGMLLETCAGLLDNDSPEDCIRKEAIEETGFAVGKVDKLFEAYMSPGSVTEIVHFFAAEYDESQRQNAGGGVEDEDIDVLEVPFSEALAMIKDGRIKDGKTIMLLQYAQIQGWLA